MDTQNIFGSHMQRAVAVMQSATIQDKSVFVSHTPYTGFSSQGRAKLRDFPRYCIAENTQLSPSLT